VLDGHRENIFQKRWEFFKMDIFEEKGHNESVDESYFATVLETIS